MINIPLQYSSGPSPAGYLPFLEEAIVARQARLSNRRMLRPAIELGSYTCRAVIDFIDINVETVSLTGRNAVRKWIVDAVLSNSVYCWNLEGTSNSARKFKVRIQEPTAKMLSKVEPGLKLSRAGLARPGTILTLEVSLDFYAKSGKQEERDQMVALLQRTYLPGMETWASRATPRFVVGNSSSTTHLIKDRPSSHWVDPDDLPPAPPLESTLYFGAEDGNWMIRVQNKVGDKRNGSTLRVLAEREKRARIEVTLRGSELQKLGLIKLTMLSKFRFAKLQGEFFHFALPTFADVPVLPQHAAITSVLNRSERECFSRGGVVCLERWRHLKRLWFSFRPPRGPRTQSHLERLRENFRVLGKSISDRRVGTGRFGTSVSYQELNEMVSSALRDLDRRTWF